MTRQFDNSHLNRLTEAINQTYVDMVGVNHIDGGNLPHRSEIVGSLEKILEVIFPGFDRKLPSSLEDVTRQTPKLLEEIYHSLYDQICRVFYYQCGTGRDCQNCDATERIKTSIYALLDFLPQLREIVKKDVASAYAGDPAASSYDEIILSYPGIKAITIQRLAHVLYQTKTPLIPRMMTEYAHGITGIDIHPGAALGQGVFIDHGTGVIIGETAVIGDNVRIYQGVTLGALNFPKDACGMLIKGAKRHPTIGNNVTIYAGAAVLGDIVIGDNCVIGGNVWLTESLPPGTKVTASISEYKVRYAGDKK